MMSIHFAPCNLGSFSGLSDCHQKVQLPGVKNSLGLLLPRKLTKSEGAPCHHAIVPRRPAANNLSHLASSSLQPLSTLSTSTSESKSSVKETKNKTIIIFLKLYIISI